MPTINDFWTWFVANEDTYYMLHGMDLEDKDYHFGCLLERLQEFDPCVNVILAGPKHLGKATLTFTADGNPAGFLYVKNLVAQAPKLPRWKIEAFVQPKLDLALCRKKKDPVYPFDGLSIKASDIYWLPDEQNDTDGTWGIYFLFRGYWETLKVLGYEKINHYVFCILQDLLGELALAQTIGWADYEELTFDLNYAQPIDVLPHFLAIKNFIDTEDVDEDEDEDEDEDLE